MVISLDFTRDFIYDIMCDTVLPIPWIMCCSEKIMISWVNIGGQTRADFFKSLHESAKSAVRELFADFLQTFFHEMQTFCRLLQTFSVDHLLSCTLFAHFLHTFCSK